MIQQWFAALNDVLDDLIVRYPNASGEERGKLQEQWEMLKTLSDDMIESWLRLEDKMGQYRELQQHDEAASASEAASKAHQQSYVDHPAYQKGQGYFKLHLFSLAAEQLEEAVGQLPEFVSARMYLAMSHMHMQQWEDAEHHFQLTAAISENNKLRAIALNALGCIQAIYAHLDQARVLFRKALDTDPTFADPRRNLERCQSGIGQLELMFGSVELTTIVH